MELLTESDMLLNDIFFGECIDIKSEIDFQLEFFENPEEDSSSQDFKLEEDSSSHDFQLGHDVDEIFETDLIFNYNLVDDCNIMQMNFITFMKNQEMDLYNESFIESYFILYKCSMDEIVQKTRTQLWMDNCIYGLQFQAYICMIKNIPLPIVAQRNRKQPILSKIESRKPKGVTTDIVLENLFKRCKNDKGLVNRRHRDAPRNQVGLLIFLLDMLNHPYYKRCIKWEDKCSLTFKIINSKLVAYYWMVVKENDTCNFENFARGIRYLRRGGYFKQIDKKKQRTYQFNKKAIKEYKSKRLHNDLSDRLFANLK